jgi:hypothetical protein
VAPLYVTYQSLAGIRPLEPGFKRVELRPQLADLEELEFIAHTVRGPLHFSAKGKVGARELMIDLPPGCEGELILSRQEKVTLAAIDKEGSPPNCRRYRLPAGSSTLRLSFT